MSSMTVTVNGKRTSAADSVTLATLLQENGIDANTDGVAVALNSIVVPRSKWMDVRLSDGDVIEVINAVQGG
jgi:sulfur carrier protein